MSRQKYLGRLAASVVRFLWQKRLGARYNARAKVLCRFHPSCSEYAALALSKYGLVSGVIRMVKRLRRCNPENTDSCVDFP